MDVIEEMLAFLDNGRTESRGGIGTTLSGISVKVCP